MKLTGTLTKGERAALLDAQISDASALALAQLFAPAAEQVEEFRLEGGLLKLECRHKVLGRLRVEAEIHADAG